MNKVMIFLIAIILIATGNYTCTYAQETGSFTDSRDNKVYKTDDLVKSDDVFLAITGISSGELLTGVRYFSGGAKTQSLAMRSLSGTIRWIDSTHNLTRINKL